MNPRMSPLDVGGQVGWSAEPDLHSKGEDLGWLSEYQKSPTRALGASRQPWPRSCGFAHRSSRLGAGLRRSPADRLRWRGSPTRN
jgi:hypothetical protein